MPKIDSLILNGVSYDLSSSEGGLTEDIKQALLQITSKVAYTDTEGQDYYDELYEALYNESPKTLMSISAVYTQGGTVYNIDSLDVLKTSLVVTAHYDDSSSSVITRGYVLSGTLATGTSTITVSYMGKTTTFNVTVTDFMDSLSFFNGCNFGIFNNKMYTSTGDDKRACAFLTEQFNDAVMYDGSKVTGWEDPAYAFPIPNGCTKITVSCTDLCCAINCHHEEDGVVTAVDGGYWSSVGGETDYDISSFIANGATHISIGFRNSSNTSLENTTVDSTTVSISFS